MISSSKRGTIIKLAIRELKEKVLKYHEIMGKVKICALRDKAKLSAIKEGLKLL